MPDIVQQYLEANDNADDYAESLLAGLYQQSLEDIDNLFRSETERDDELWTHFDVDPDLVIQDYEDEAPEDRVIDWTLGLAGLATAAPTQFFLDNREELLIKPLAYREQVLDGFDLSLEQLVQAGKRGIDVETTMRFHALQAKYLDEVSFLRDMSNTEAYEALKDYSALRPQAQMIADSTGYVSRMTSYKKGSPQFKEAVTKLVDTNSQRALKCMNRRSIERIYSYREANGDLDTVMVWIGEPGKHNCAFCPPLFGEEKTYRAWIEYGQPGAEICAGGDH